MERKTLFTALFGSHNYNLNDETSDEDYKAFVLPTFDDLYTGNRFSSSVISEGRDVDTHDIRQLGHLWWKANINFLEVLYSKVIDAEPDYFNPLSQLFCMRQDIVTMNLPYLFNACMGMSIEKEKKLNKITPHSQDRIEKYGYDTKEALHSYRVLDFLERFYARDFKDFGGAMRYEDGDRQQLLRLKHGRYTEENFRITLYHKRRWVNELKSEYDKMKPNERTKNEVEKIIKEIVKGEIINAGNREGKHPYQVLGGLH